MESAQLARQFFLIAHDAYTGKASVSRELLGCGLVAIQLADLMIAGRLAMNGDRVVVAAARPAPESGELDAFVVERVASEASGHTVRTWTDTLGAVVYESVAQGLVDSGVVRRERRLLTRRGQDRYPAVDLLASSRPRLRLEHMLRRPNTFHLAGGLCAVVAGSIGRLEKIIDADLDRVAVESLVAELEGHLPADLRQVVHGVREAVSAVSLTVRR